MARVVVNKIGLDKLRQTLKDSNKITTQVGWFESAKYDDGVQVAGIAAQNELGNAKLGIPPRPFVRPTIEDKSQEWIGIAKKGADAVVNGSVSMTQVMDALGLKAAADIKNAISNYQGVPLKEATIKSRLRKKADGKTVGNLDKALVESAIMLTTLTHETTK